MDEFTGADLDFIDELEEVMATVNTQLCKSCVQQSELSLVEEKTKVYLEHFKS